MLLSYSGKRYFGMQLQKDAPTIEGCLLDAMYKCSYITEEQKNRPYSFYFQRASRTDRSVSALRQVCSMKLPLNENFPLEGPSALNEVLPNDIRVMGIRRTTPGFHAQKNCDSRTYSYTLPTFAFAKFDTNTTYSYRITQKAIDEVNEILRLFLGTHNFFNYTRLYFSQSDDRSCSRYIMEFKCGDLRLYKDDLSGQEVEFLTILIRGQSFMLHQIRKMIGMTITIVRGFLYKSDIQRSFDTVRMDVPRAPGLGLLLEKLHYHNYDRKFKKTHESLDDWGEEIESKVKKMRDELIIPQIMKQEIQTQSFVCYLTFTYVAAEESQDSQEVPISPEESNCSQEVKTAAEKVSNSQEVQISPEESSSNQEVQISLEENSSNQEVPISPEESNCSQEVKTAAEKVSNNQEVQISPEESSGNHAINSTKRESSTNVTGAPVKNECVVNVQTS
uniref:Pseudouridylate synthase 1 homolog n=1 Tax=Syphacia muris TaxID=451379 RepID=A0A158R5Y5_9BILA